MIQCMQRALIALGVLLAGCSSVSSRVVRTGPALAARGGPVAIFVAATPPSSARVIGKVEVRGDNHDGAVEVLLPTFAEKVALLGGDGAAIDSVDTHFELRERMTVETYTYQCGFYTCTGTHTVPMLEEVAIVTMRGRALKLTAERP